MLDLKSPALEKILQNYHETIRNRRKHILYNTIIQNTRYRSFSLSDNSDIRLKIRYVLSSLSSKTLFLFIAKYLKIENSGRVIGRY